jgi:hypothetical protein
MKGSDVDARLQRLERENRRLRVLVGAAVALAAIPFLSAFTPPNDRIEASEFTVRDKAGMLRARLFIDEHNTTRLILVDGDGKSQAILASGQAASLVLADKDGAPTITLNASMPKPVESATKANPPASSAGPLDGRY